MKMQKRARTCLCISVGLMVLALVLSLFGLGINRGIDFEGGLTLVYDLGSSVNVADAEQALDVAKVNPSDRQVAIIGTAGTQVQIRVKSISTQDDVKALRATLESELLAKYPNMDQVDVTESFVGPVASGTLLRNAIWSVLAAAAAMLIYIALRFDLNMGVAAVAGILHDVLIMLSFMVFFRSFVQMNSTFVAAMLTIVGYSINNTIIIFDRIRENHRKAAYANMPREEIVTISVKESLGRTINTTLTTLVTILALYILGVTSIKEFALPIIVGILAGVYSANMINGYIWAALTEWRKDRAVKAKQAKAAAKA